MALGTTRWERRQHLLDSTTRYRVFLSTDQYGTDRKFRFFYRPLATPTRWVEFDLTPRLKSLNPWLENDYTLAYMHAYVVRLDQHGPEEIMVKTGGGNYAPGYRTSVDQTLLLALDGPPRLLWQSIDGRREEVPPISSNEAGEMIGGNQAECSRTVAMRKGLVYVSRIHQSGKFEDPDPQLTPITPGYYQYQKGRFQRVTPPKDAPHPKP